MQTIIVITDSDDFLKVRPKADGQTLTSLGTITRALFEQGESFSLDSNLTGDISWDVDTGDFTMKYNGNCPEGIEPVELTVWYDGSDLGTVVISPRFDNPNTNSGSEAALQVKGVTTVL